jgi:hypothetical protein
MGPDSQPESIPAPPLRGDAEPSLEEVRRRHPGYDVLRVFGGFEAVPKGTPVIRAAWLSSMDQKLITAEELDTL